MQGWMKEREKRLREFFGLAPDVELIPRENVRLEISSRVAEHLTQFNLEWHIVPEEKAVPIDDDPYRVRLYPMLKLDPKQRDYKKKSSYKAIINGHRNHQGRLIGVETTPKPRYLPRN